MTNNVLPIFWWQGMFGASLSQTTEIEKNLGFNGGDDNASFRFPVQLVDHLKTRLGGNERAIIVDIGTARGDIARWLIKQDERFRVIGLDRDPSMIQAAQAAS